jgi:hypothetical protein
MGELLMLFITGGGSTAMGAILKGVFGYVFEAKAQKHDLEMAREARANDNFLRLQAEISKGGTGEFVSFTRRCLAIIGVSTLCTCIILCTLYPQAEIVTFTNADGEGVNEFLFGLISFQANQTPITISSGHISLMGCTVILPCILGFYFGPSGRRG